MKTGNVKHDKRVALSYFYPDIKEIIHIFHLH